MMVVTLQAVKEGKAAVPLGSKLEPLRLVYVAERVDLRPLIEALELQAALEKLKQQ